MSMKARIENDALGNVIVRMEGGLDVENGLPFRQELESITKNNPTARITIDMDNVDFVGSSGIGIFVETINSLNKRKNQIELSNVKTEFLRVFKLYNMTAMETLFREFETDETEDLSTRFANRRQTFEN